MVKDSFINRLVNNLPIELHGWDPNVGWYSSCGPGTKHTDRVKKYIETGDTDYIFKNELDKACFYHDSAYGKHKDVESRHKADRELIDNAYRIVDHSQDGYQRALAAMVAQFFEKKIQNGQGLSRTQRLKLKDTYYNPETGYSSIAELSRRTKIKSSDIQKWLMEQEVYTRHKPIKVRYKTRRVITSGIDQQWQADLCDMSSLSNFNSNYRYILTVIDIFSKFAWAVPIKTKTGIEITKAFEKIFKTRKPRKMQTDKGTEFINKHTQNLFNKNKIQWFATENETKAQIVERFNRTLKERMYKYFTAQNTKKWIDVVSKLVKNYNTSYHTSIKMTPEQASIPKNEGVVRDNLYSDDKQIAKPHFEVGDNVRISKHKGKFKKGYTPNYTSEIFVIKKVLNTIPVTYKIIDKNGEEIKGSFYSEELSKFITQ